LSTPDKSTPASPAGPRPRGRLVVAGVLIAVALAALALVDRLRTPSAGPAAPHEPAQTLIVPPQPPVEAAPSAATPSTPPPDPPVVVNEPERLPPPPPTRSRPPEPAASNEAAGYLVQAGMFTSASNAQALQKKLTQAGIKARVETRVQLGPFKDRAEAEQAISKLRKLGINAVLVPAR
jgi:cell division protein FtsN